MGETELRTRLLEEYVDTEQRYLRFRDALPPGSWAETRYEALCADPIGELRRIYTELDLEFTPAFERRLAEYIAETEDYTPRTKTRESEALGQEVHDRLRTLAAQLGYNEHAPLRADGPGPSRSANRGSTRQLRLGACAIVAASGLCTAAWLLLDVAIGEYRAQLNRLVYPVALAAGYAAHRCSAKGSTLLGILSVAAAFTALAVIVFANLKRHAGPMETVTYWNFLNECVRAFATWPTVFWVIVGAISAFRLGRSPRLPWW
jgi:hypothetical protein